MTNPFKGWINPSKGREMADEIDRLQQRVIVLEHDLQLEKDLHNKKNLRLQKVGEWILTTFPKLPGGSGVVDLLKR